MPCWQGVPSTTPKVWPNTVAVLLRFAADLPNCISWRPPTRPKRIPSVLTKAEVACLLGAMDGEIALLAKLLYGTGMRLMEGLRLRVKDVDFDHYDIMVRDGNSGTASPLDALGCMMP